MTEQDWQPPFDGRRAENVWCPVCGVDDVHARIDSSEDPRPAYCGSCHASLSIEVFETFGSAMLADG